MFRELAKQKRELTFAGITLFILVVLTIIVVLSLRFLVIRLSDALQEPEVKDSEILKFNLDEFEKLGLEK